MVQEYNLQCLGGSEMLTLRCLLQHAEARSCVIGIFLYMHDVVEYS